MLNIKRYPNHPKPPEQSYCYIRHLGNFLDRALCSENLPGRRDLGFHYHLLLGSQGQKMGQDRNVFVQMVHG